MISERKQLGAFYTPADVVERLLELACTDRPGRVLDPSCGAGHFLVPAARRGADVVGIDIDPVAIERCAQALPDAALQCADAFEVSLRPEFDLVIGNPPFLSQLSATTSRSAVDIARLRERFGDVMGALTDPAALFLLLSLEAARRDGGVVCLIQPMSTLSSRDVAAVRRRVLEQSSMVAAWLCEDDVFDDAAVRVWAPILVRGAAPGPIQLYVGRDFEPAGTVDPAELDAPTWSALLAAAKGLPRRALATDGTLADIASATADFRDQYYGLRGHVVDALERDDSSWPALITSGLLDPAHVAWGERATKFDKVAYRWPRVDLGALPATLAAWAGARLQPKVMLATQTKVLEAAVDADGRYLPSVPVISLVPHDAGDLWRLGALLSSPPATLVAARRHLGAALSSDALKLRAAEVLDLPLPADRAAWDAGARAFRLASAGVDRLLHLTEAARHMCLAHGLDGDDELLSWWLDRLPRASRSTVSDTASGV